MSQNKIELIDFAIDTSGMKFIIEAASCVEKLVFNSCNIVFCEPLELDKTIDYQYQTILAELGSFKQHSLEKRIIKDNFIDILVDAGGFDSYPLIER